MRGSTIKISMIRVDIQRYIMNRMWFGWWFAYSGNTVGCGKWMRDYRYTRVSMILVNNTFTPGQRSRWSLLYEDI